MCSTEICFAAELANDPGLMTACRFNGNNGKTTQHKFMRGICLKFGCIKPGERIDLDQTYAKAVHALLQFAFTCLCSLPALFLYTSPWASNTYLALCLIYCIWNGATFYFEVFNGRRHGLFIECGVHKVNHVYFV